MNNITTIQTTICQVIAAQLGMADRSTITPDSNLADLGADSLDTIEIIMQLEEEFEVQINDTEFEVVETVRQVIDLVVRLRS